MPPTGDRGGLPAAATATAAAVVAPPPAAPGELGRVGDGVRTPPLVEDSARRLLREAAEVRGTGQAREHDRVVDAAAAAEVAAAAADAPEEEEGGVCVVGARGGEAEPPGKVGVGEMVLIRGGEAGQLAGTPAAAAESGTLGDVGSGVELPSPPPPPPPPCWRFSLAAPPAEGDGVEEEGGDCTLYVTTSSNRR